MAKGGYVLEMLRPNGGWVITEDDFDSIRWDEGVEPVTKAEFDAAFAQVDIWLNQREAEAQAKREAALSKLAALGLTADDLRALGL